MVTESGWQSSYTLPLFWGDGLLGFFFLNSLELATFQPELLDRIKVSVELLATLLTHEISQLRNLRWLVQILFMLATSRIQRPVAMWSGFPCVAV